MKKVFVVEDAYTDELMEIFDTLDDAMEFCDEFPFTEYPITYYEYFKNSDTWYAVNTTNDYDDEYIFAIRVKFVPDN